MDSGAKLEPSEFMVIDMKASDSASDSIIMDRMCMAQLAAGDA